MFGVENRTTVPIEVTLNISKAKNCAYSSATPVIKKVVQPNKFETFVHVRRQNIQKELKFEYDLKYSVLTA